MFVVHLCLHVAVQNRTSFTCAISITITLFPISFSFPLVAQKLLPFPGDSHGNRIRMHISSDVLQ